MEHVLCTKPLSSLKYHTHFKCVALCVVTQIHFENMLFLLAIHWLNSNVYTLVLASIASELV